MLTSKLILKETKYFAIRSDNTEIASIKQMLTATSFVHISNIFGHALILRIF